jgi:hypothetical protein
VFAALRGRLDGVTVAVIVPRGRLTPAVLNSDRWRPTPAPLGMIWRPPNAA